VPSPCPRLGYLNNGERLSVVQGRLKRRGDDVVAPPRTPVVDYITSGTVCQQRMHNVPQTSRQRWRPPALMSAWGRGGCFETSEVWDGPVPRSLLIRTGQM